MPAKAMPVLPDVGSIMMLLSLFSIPFLSASFTIQYAALSFTEPNGLYHSNFAKNFTFPVAKESNSTSGVFPITGELRFQARDAFRKASFETAARFVFNPAQIDVH